MRPRRAIGRAYNHLVSLEEALTPDAIARYHELGFVELGPALAPDVCKVLRGEKERFRPPGALVAGAARGTGR